MPSRFVVHQHKTGRVHFDLRFLQNGVLRSWSLLREPPQRAGERRLAIERESFTEDSFDAVRFEEQAFGMGRVAPWDVGEVEFEELSPRLVRAVFSGKKVFGKYEFQRMRWYPGNRWILTKISGELTASRRE